MRSNQKRHFLLAIGIAFVALLGLLGRAHGVVPGIVLLALALFCLILSCLVQPEGKDSKHPYWTPYEVQFDDVEVRVLFKGEPRSKIAWADIEAVGVAIDESLIPAPWWVLFEDSKTHCRYPSEATGSMAMLAEMRRRLPGFDKRPVAPVMDRADGGRLVWSKSSNDA